MRPQETVYNNSVEGRGWYDADVVSVSKPSSHYHMKIKEVSEITVIRNMMKQAALKANFSTSPRKVNKLNFELGVFKLDATPERVTTMNSFIEDLQGHDIQGWSIFSSRDGDTTGLKKMLTSVE